MGFGPEDEERAGQFLEGLRNYPYEFVYSLDSPECLQPGVDWEIGSKAWHLAVMRQAGLPVPPGFVVRAGVGRKYKGLSVVEFHRDESLAKEIVQQLVLMGAESWQFFNSTLSADGYWSDERPQLVSVRSGSKYSMPGMMGTILNVGINDERLPKLEAMLGRQCALDCYRNYGYSYLETMFDVSVRELRQGYDRLLEEKGEVDSVERELEYLKWWHRSRTIDREREFEGLELSMAKDEALFLSLWAVFHSWEARRARVNRRSLGIPEEAWTAVTVMPMVYGNLNEQSGSGVLYTHDPQTGKSDAKCSYAAGEQGIKVVGGVLDPREMDSLPEEIREQLYLYGRQLTDMFGCGQDVEFTVQNGQLVLLQTRDQHLGPLPQVEMTGHLFLGRKIQEASVLKMVPQGLLARLGTQIKPEVWDKAFVLGKGDGVGGGAGLGRMALSYERAQDYANQGHGVVLVVDQIDPHQPMENITGLITVRGDSTSHGGNVVNSRGIPGLIGCGGLFLGEGGEVFFGQRQLAEGDWIVVDGIEGVVCGGLGPEDLETITMPDHLVFIPQLRERWLGGTSLLTDAAVAMGLEDGVRETTATVRKVLVETQDRWYSQKAVAQALINAVLPKDLVIPYIVCKPDSKKLIREFIEKGWQLGWDAAVRSAYNPPLMAKNPWRSLPIGQTASVDEFLDPENGNNSLSSWRRRDGLTEVLVGWLPGETLEEAMGQEHFVWTLFGSKKHGVVCRVIPNTPQLRAFESVNAEKRLEGRVKMMSGLDSGVGNMRWIFPPAYYQDEQVVVVSERDNWQGVWGSLIAAAFEHLHESPENVFSENDDHNKRVLVETVMAMARGGRLTREEEDMLIKPQILAITRHLENQVFGTRWGEIVVAMAALENVLGPLTLEGQGRINGDNSLQWLKIYGIKGLEEKVAQTNNH